MTTITTTTTENDWYIFVLPEDFGMAANFEADEGHAFKFSELCNPDWVASNGYPNCEQAAFRGFCKDMVIDLVYLASENAEGIWETALQCPQCGCRADGAVNLNDLYDLYGQR